MLKAAANWEKTESKGVQQNSKDEIHNCEKVGLDVVLVQDEDGDDWS